MRNPIDNFIPDQVEARVNNSRPLVLLSSKLPMETMLLTDKEDKEDKEEKPGRRTQRLRERRKAKNVEVRAATLNVGSMTGKGRELAGTIERRKVDILCVQETKWKGSKARSIGGGFKLLYHGVDGRRNGVGIIVKEDYAKSVVKVKRKSGRMMSVRIEIEGVMMNAISAYAPQMGCELEEKEGFWNDLDEIVESVHKGERVLIGADLNEHVGEGSRGDEEVMGRHGFKERNLEGQMVVDFAKRIQMAVLYTYFRKKEKQRVTYKW